MTDVDPSSIIHLHPNDNIAVARRFLTPGESIEHAGYRIVVSQLVRPGHKIAITPIPHRDTVLKFGQIIGFASKEIQPGEHVHTQNLSCDDFTRDYQFSSQVPVTRPASTVRSFDGFLRDSGRVGTRNMIAVIGTVNCASAVSRRIADHFTEEHLRDFANVDAVFPVTHKTGCGMVSSGIDREYLHRVLTGFACHPNVFAYVLVSLGCEVNQPGDVIEVADLVQGSARQKPIVISIQALGGITRAVEEGIRAVSELLPRANQCRRTRQPASRIVLGTNCGGSDGHSGITANPALGIASDLVVAQGGTSILGETTEIYGAEHLLTRRAVTPDVGQKLIDRIRWWEWYTSTLGGEINNNPSFGNKEGGLTTIYEKSLGAVAKGGSTALVDVLEYGEQTRTPGFVVMDTPGFDPVSVTGIVAGGANVVVFTTGRGSVFGCKPTPSIKVATHSPLYEHMKSDMDFDAGVILAGASVEETGQHLFEMILEVASGQKTKSEQQGIGEDEFAPWTVGPVL